MKRYACYRVPLVALYSTISCHALSKPLKTVFVQNPGLPSWAGRPEKNRFLSMSSLTWIRGLQFYTFFGFSIGIKRRMIDITKKYFLQNVWKYTVFSHLHLKYAKSAIMTQKNLSCKISIWVSKKRRILCWFQICWCRLSKMPLTKVKSKKPRKNVRKRKYSKFDSFLAITFLRAFV